MYDLPLLLAVLASSGQMEEPPADAAFLGELALDGSLRPVSGVLPMALAAERAALSSAQVLLVRIVSGLGTTAIAANSLGVSAESLCYMAGYGIQDAALALVGQAVGANRREGSVFLVEGYKDVLAMHAAGFKHTVGLCGTILSKEHIALLKRYATSVRVMLDADKAGRKGTDETIPAFMGEGMEAVRIGLPEGDDPDSLFRRLGKEAFAAYVREAVRRTLPSDEQLLLGRIRKGIGLLSDVSETERRERLLLTLDDCLEQLKGLSADASRPATMDWRWA